MKIAPLLFLLWFSVIAFGQLPEKWMGHYAGDLNVLAVNGKTSIYHMEFKLEPISDSNYNWTIIYGEDSLRQEREYILSWRNGNRYVIDEQNGIILPCNRFDNAFISVFEVQGNLIHATYTFKKRKLLFQLTSSTSRSETGNTTYEAKEIPLVWAYETVASQRAVLKKIKRNKSK